MKIEVVEQDVFHPFKIVLSFEKKEDVEEVLRDIHTDNSNLADKIIGILNPSKRS